MEIRGLNFNVSKFSRSLSTQFVNKGCLEGQRAARINPVDIKNEFKQIVLIFT